jgi:hypothetical protein
MSTDNSMDATESSMYAQVDAEPLVENEDEKMLDNEKNTIDNGND